MTHQLSVAPTAAETAIQNLVNQLQNGWNSHSGQAFAAPFAEDADYVIVDGRYIQGQSVIAAGHQHIFDTVYRDSHNTATIENIRFLREDVAIVRVQWQLNLSEGDPEYRRKARSMMVMTCENGEWRIDAFQNTPVTVFAEERS